MLQFVFACFFCFCIGCIMSQEMWCNISQVIWNTVKLEFWILVALYHIFVLKALIKIPNFIKFQPSDLYWLLLWVRMIQLLLKTMLLNELISLYHTNFWNILTKINFCIFHSSNLYYWLVLLKGMHHLSENIVQYIPFFLDSVKKDFTKLLVIHRIFV